MSIITKRLFKFKETSLNKEVDHIYSNIGKLNSRIEVLSGSGTPSDKLGKDGDIYINLSNKQLFYKEAGKWK